MLRCYEETERDACAIEAVDATRRRVGRSRFALALQQLELRERGRRVPTAELVRRVVATLPGEFSAMRVSFLLRVRYGRQVSVAAARRCLLRHRGVARVQRGLYRLVRGQLELPLEPRRRVPSRGAGAHQRRPAPKRPKVNFQNAG